MEDKERTRALDLALSQIEKQFGKGSIVRLGSKEAIVPIAVISSGAISIDAALGTGDPMWMHAALVTVSVFIATEQTGLAPLGVALHGLAVVAGFLILLAALPFPSVFAVLPLPWRPARCC